MGREVRRVPPGWQHPRNSDGNYKPPFEGPSDLKAEHWYQCCVAWHESLIKYRNYWEWNSGPPNPDDYMPHFGEDATHYQLYETTTEGTPISPVFASMDELLDWAAEHASWFADMKADRDTWREGLTRGIAGLVYLVRRKEAGDARDKTGD
jgi:hypothetical protein